MICSTLTPNRSGKENPCYTQIRLQKIRILEIRELHNGWLQCGLITDDDLGKMYRFSDVSELAYAVCSTFDISSSFDNKRMREVAAQRHDKKKNVSDLVEIYYGLV